MIRFLHGDDLGVPRIPEAMVVEWTEGDARVVLSYAKLGPDGITLHFAAAPKSLRRVKDAINDACEWLFWAYPWCNRVYGIIGRDSVARLVVKCGFKHIGEQGDHQIFERVKS